MAQRRSALTMGSPLLGFFEDSKRAAQALMPAAPRLVSALRGLVYFPDAYLLYSAAIPAVCTSPGCTITRYRYRNDLPGSTVCEPFCDLSLVKADTPNGLAANRPYPRACQRTGCRGFSGWSRIATPTFSSPMVPE